MAPSLASREECSESFYVAPKIGLRMRWRLLLRMRERPPRLRVVRVPWHHVRVQVRQRVSEQLVVQLHRLEMLLERPADPEELFPVRVRLLVRELGGLGDVAATPDDDRVPALDAGLLQVRVRDFAGKEAGAVRSLVGPALAAHRTALSALELIERLRPLHAASIADLSARDSRRALRTRHGCAAHAARLGVGDVSVRRRDDAASATSPRRARGAAAR